MNILKNFISDQRGNFASIFALSTPVILLSVGMTVNYSTMVTSRSDVKNISDAAILAGVNQARNLMRDGEDIDEAFEEGKKTAQEWFNYKVDLLPSISAASFSPSIEFVDNTIVGKSNTSVSVKLHLPNVMGSRFKQINIKNAVNVGGFANAHFHFLLDISGSMGIGANYNDIIKMKSDRSIKCAFACHNTVGHVRAAGYELRYDVVTFALDKLIDKLHERNLLAKNAKQRSRASLYGFSNTLYPSVQDESSLTKVKDALKQLKLNFGHTNFSTALRALNSRLPNKPPAGRKNIIVLITDGYSERGAGHVNIADCNAIKSKENTEIFTMNLLRLSPHNGKAVSNNDKVKESLQNCSSKPENAYEAGTSIEIINAFDDLLLGLEGSTRLTL